jgi:membrane protease YdiL (CAAX protease family)
MRRRWDLAIACACVLGLVLLAGAFGYALIGPESADHLALGALVASGAFGLLAIGGAALAGEPLAERLGLGPGRLRGLPCALGVVGLLGLSHALDGLLHATGLQADSAILRFEETVAGRGPRELALSFVALVLAAPLGEELLFRGLVQRGLAPALGGAPAAAAAALAFGVAHADFALGLAAVFLGVYLGLLALAADSIRVAIAAHALNNAAALIETAAGLRRPAGGAVLWAWIAFGLVVAGAGLAAVARGGRAGPPQPDP